MSKRLSSKYRRQLRLLKLKALRKLDAWNNPGFWLSVLCFTVGCFGAFMLALYIGFEREDREFRLHAVTTEGYLVGESACRDGTRFGHSYCYTIRFTSQNGEEITFHDRGLTSYRTGLYVLRMPMSVEYLPYRPQSARLSGRGNDSFFLWFGLIVLSLSLFYGVKLYQVLRSLKTLKALQWQLKVLLSRRCFDEALELALAAAADNDREILLTMLLTRLSRRGEVQRVQDILARQDIPDIQKAIEALGMELR